MRPDLLSELRDARPLAPAELRERVRRVGAASGTHPAASPPRRLTWRRALVIALPAAAAVAGASILLPGGSTRTSAPPPSLAYASAPTAAKSAAGAGPPAPDATRAQRIAMSLQLRVRNAEDVSDATKRAVAIARGLGGYPSRLSVDAAGRTGSASLVLRIPKQNVQPAVARLSALGTIVGENVSIQDLQAQVDASARKLDRLRARLAYWQTQPQTDAARKQVASFTAAIAKLDGARAATIRASRLATLHLELTTRPPPAVVERSHGPLHGLGVAFRWLGIGAVYVVALGAPLLLLGALVWLAARALRRRRENELLGSS